MNEFVTSGDSFSLQRNGADVINDGLTVEPGKVYGRTKVFKNGDLVHNELKPMFEDGSSENAIVGGNAMNTVPNDPPNTQSDLPPAEGLKSLFARNMSVNTDGALSSLFVAPSFTVDTAGGAIPAGNHNRSGILIAASSSPNDGGARSMVTTNIPASNTYGRKWRGVFSATAAAQFAYAVIGYNVGTTYDINPQGAFLDAFVTPYATQQFPTQTLANGDTLTIEWEIFIA